MGPHDLADRLLEQVVAGLAEFEARYAPGLVLPRAFAGWSVGSDARADLAYTLGLLHEAGIDAVGDLPIGDALPGLLSDLDPEDTHTFSSYRVAETLAAYGKFDGNPLLGSLDDEARERVAAACDSTSWIPLLDDGLPANYAAVLARTEAARAAIGLETDPAVLRSLLERTVALLAANPTGYVDDSGPAREGRYDIYTIDIHLFTEPFADELEPHWSRGLAASLDLVAAVAASNGAALTWGRSLGVLALCHTVELEALALARGASPDPQRSLERATRAAERIPDWFSDGVATAHHHRSQDHYRGPARWLQLTFDCLGKLVWSALRLRRAPADIGTLPPGARKGATPGETYRDTVVSFDEEAAVWSVRTPGTAFVIPFVGTAWADYLPAPRNPGIFEVPVDIDLPTGVPVAWLDGRRYVGGGRPSAITAAPRPPGVDTPGSPDLEVVWDHLPELAGRGSAHGSLEVHRRVAYRVERRTLHVDEWLQFPAGPPEALTVQVTEAAGRRLGVEWRSDRPLRSTTVQTDGIAAYRSFWGELVRVHQAEVSPAESVHIGWSITPRLRVAVADPSHHYHRSLYTPLEDRVEELRFGGHLLARPDEARERLASVDMFHLHWPEWFVSTPAEAEAFISLLDDTGTALVWTQHNLVPHDDGVQDAEALYSLFAARADVVVHHSAWGRDAVTSRYRFRPDAVHAVIPHGHFGNLASPGDRGTAERTLRLEPCAIRIGIIGAPRRDKQTQAFMEAFAQTRRDDLQLLVLSLDHDEHPPPDPRITALPYEFVTREVYDLRLATVDVIALPFDPDGDMLTTGTVGDVVALGLPTLASSWGYLTETLGAAAIPFGDDLVATLERLNPADLEVAAAASRALQPVYAWTSVAERFLAVLDGAGVARR